MHEGAAYWQQCVSVSEWVRTGTYEARRSLSLAERTIAVLYSSRLAVYSPVGAELRQIMTAPDVRRCYATTTAWMYVLLEASGSR
jgi:hypothetical protein